MWKQLSDELKTATAKAARALVHVGGRDVAGRTGVVWADELVLTLAQQARDGEPVPVVLPGGAEVTASVHAWDPRTGLAVLRVPGVADPKWVAGPVPSVGELALTVAFPSPQGPEARLDLVRFVASGTEWGRGVTLDGYFQTDGGSYPGFTGSVVVDSAGALIGFVAENRSGNGGFAVSAADLARLAAPLVAAGSPKQVWLGISTRPAGGQGLALLSVDSGSPADRAGWSPGDLLLSLAGRSLKDPKDLLGALSSLVPDGEVSARVLRDGEVHDWPVTPTSRR